MRLTQLQIRNFRNLKLVDFEPGEGINLITGNNASGKTSLLEAIYYLSHLRSFRTQHLADLINHNSKNLQLFARVNSNKREIPIGIRRGRDSLEVRADQLPVKRVADITSMIPVLAIHPDSYKLISGNPAQRRQFIDWGVFHVEHGFFDAWQRYRKALSQRNAAIKSKMKQQYCAIWDRQIDVSASHIDYFRSTYLSSLQPLMQRMVSSFFPDQTVSIEYKRGWKSDESLFDVLKASFERDRKLGFTASGPHRADLQIQVNAKSAQTAISRGQQKLIVALMRLSQVQNVIRSDKRRCILLYDDLAAELDSANRLKILSVIEEMPIQVYMTAIDPGQITVSSDRALKMFHVEQGCVYQRD
jgi:DNA replication and repair protein RecF